MKINLTIILCTLHEKLEFEVSFAIGPSPQSVEGGKWNKSVDLQNGLLIKICNCS